jgi:hypothetical protein
MSRTLERHTKSALPSDAAGRPFSQRHDRPDVTDTDEWRNDAAEPVLRLLYQAGIAVTGDVVETNLGAVADVSPTTAAVSAALAELEGENFVRTFAETDDYYLITDRGRGHVANELEHEGFGFVD